MPRKPMQKTALVSATWTVVVGVVAVLTACKAELSHREEVGGATGGTAGAIGSGGTGGGARDAGMDAIATGGRATGGSATGGVSTGGIATGGSRTGGAGTGGVSTGGSATGGSSTGGSATGGSSTGGSGTGGSGTGGTAGAGGSPACVPACTGVFTCRAGQCVCPDGMTSCSGVCVDTTSDAHHCGSCTTICPDACGVGRCYKTVVKAGGNYSAFAVNATDFYFLSRQDGNLTRVPRNGGPTTVVATGQYYSAGMAIDASTLYWLDGGNVSALGGVYKMPLPAGTATEFVTGEPAPIVITLDATNVYWSTYSPHFIKKVPKAGGDVTVLVSEDNADRASNLLVDAKNVYWTSLVGGGTIFKLPSTGGSPVPIANNLVGVDNGGLLAVTGGQIYFADIFSKPPMLRKLSVDGGALTPLTSSASLSSIIADDAAIYMAMGHAATIVRVSLDGATVTPLAAYTANYIAQMTVQGNDLFWMTSDGAIQSTAKTP